MRPGCAGGGLCIRSSNNPENLLVCSAIADFLSYRFVGFPCSLGAAVSDGINRNAFGNCFFKGFQARDISSEKRYLLARQFGAELRPIRFRQWRHSRKEDFVFVGGKLADGTNRQY